MRIARFNNHLYEGVFAQGGLGPGDVHPLDPEAETLLPHCMLWYTPPAHCMLGYSPPPGGQV